MAPEGGRLGAVPVAWGPRKDTCHPCPRSVGPAVQPWLCSSGGRSVVPMRQGCGFDPQSAHMREPTPDASTRGRATRCFSFSPKSISWKKTGKEISAIRLEVGCETVPRPHGVIIHTETLHYRQQQRRAGADQRLTMCLVKGQHSKIKIDFFLYTSSQQQKRETKSHEQQRQRGTGPAETR